MTALLPAAAELQASRFAHVFFASPPEPVARRLLSSIGARGSIVPCTPLADALSDDLVRVGAWPTVLRCARGAVDLDELMALLGARPAVPLVLLAFSRIVGAGGWIGLDQVSAVRTACAVASVPLVIDAEGVFENAEHARRADPYLVHHRPEDVALRTFDLADACFSRTEGFVAVRDRRVAERVRTALGARAAAQAGTRGS